MSENIEKTSTFAVSVNSTIEKFRKALIASLIAVVVAVIAIIAVIVINSKIVESDMDEFETVSYNLIDKSSTLTGDELKKLQNDTIAQLQKFSKKSGIVGVRSSMLLGDLYLKQNDFEKARLEYLKAAENGKKSYTNPLAYFNAAVCSEKLKDFDSAVNYYKNASEFADFLLIDHTLFSLARVYEEKNDNALAIETYQKLYDLHPTSSWAKLAKSQLIMLKVLK